jgi:hypothetical protein
VFRLPFLLSDVELEITNCDTQCRGRKDERKRADSGYNEARQKLTILIMIGVHMAPESTTAELQVVPIEYAGQWIAWNDQGTRIVASGHTLPEAVQAATAAGAAHPVFAKVPKSDVRFAGLQR